MHRYSKIGLRDTSIQMICVKGVFVVEQRRDFVRRRNRKQYRKKYDRRINCSVQNINRRHTFIDIIV